MTFKGNMLRFAFVDEAHCLFLALFTLVELVKTNGGNVYEGFYDVFLANGAMELLNR